MKTSARVSSSRLALAQLVLMAFVVTGFAFSSWLIVMRMRTVGREIDDLAGNAMPSVVYLTQARGELRRIEDFVEHAVDPNLPDGGTANESIGSLRQAMDVALADYLALPYFPGESTLSHEIMDEKSAFERSALQALGAMQAGNGTAAQTLLRTALADGRRLDRALARVVLFDAMQGERVGRDANAARFSVVTSLFTVDAILAFLAMGVTALAAVAWRRAIAGMQERSSELDMFAGRVAHDVLSPLMAVGMGLALSRTRLSEDPAATATVDRSTRALERVRHLVVSLREFARAGVSPIGETTEVRATIRDVVDGAERAAERRRA